MQSTIKFYTSFALLLLAFAVCRPQALAEVVTIHFSGNVLRVGSINEAQQNARAEIGDVLVGSLTYDNAADTTSFETMSASFDLRTPQQAQFRVKIKAQEFVSQMLSNEVDDGSFRAARALQLDPPSTWGCYKGFWYEKNFEDMNTSDIYVTKMRLFASNSVCRLASKITTLGIDTYDPANWDEITLQLVYWERGYEYTIDAKITSAYFIGAEQAQVSGTIYSDQNNNCQLDDADFGIPGQEVYLIPGVHTGYTNEYGEYNIAAPPGDYTVFFRPSAKWNLSCTATPAKVSVPTPDSEARADYAFRPRQETEALEVSISLRDPVNTLSYAANFDVNVTNIGQLPYSGELRLKYGDNLSEARTAPSFADSVQQTLFWNIRDMPPGTNRYYSVVLQLTNRGEEQAGKFFCVELDADVKHQDPELILAAADVACVQVNNNTEDTDRQNLLAQVGRLNADGDIEQDVKTLTYQLAFASQSFGKARIFCQLSEFHDLNSIRTTATNLDLDMTVDESGLVIWSVDYPEAGTRYTVSPNLRHGHIKFDVDLREGLALGTVIPVYAQIFLDDRAPFETKTVRSRIVDQVSTVNWNYDGADISVYPNPASDVLNLKLESPGPVKLTLRNALGQSLLTHNVNTTGHAIDLQGFPSGTYYLSIHSAQGTTVKPLNIVR